jgi:hypothetical protein
MPRADSSNYMLRFDRPLEARLRAERRANPRLQIRVELALAQHGAQQLMLLGPAHLQIDRQRAGFLHGPVHASSASLPSTSRPAGAAVAGCA